MKPRRVLPSTVVVGVLTWMALSPPDAAARGPDFKAMANKIVDGFKSSIEDAATHIKGAAENAVDDLKKRLLDELVQKTLLEWVAKSVGAKELAASGAQILKNSALIEETADAYHEAVDGLLSGDGAKVQAGVLKLKTPIELVRRFNLQSLASALLKRARERVQPLIAIKAGQLIDTACRAVAPILKRAKKVVNTVLLALSFLMPMAAKVGKLAAKVVDEVVDLLHTKVLPVIAEQVAWLARRVLEAVGEQLVDITGRVDAAVGPVRDKLVQFLAAKLPDAASALGKIAGKVADGLRRAQDVLAALKR